MMEIKIEVDVDGTIYLENKEIGFCEKCHKEFFQMLKDNGIIMNIPKHTPKISDTTSRIEKGLS